MLPLGIYRRCNTPFNKDMSIHYRISIRVVPVCYYGLTPKEQAFAHAAAGDLPALQHAIQQGHVNPLLDIDPRGASLLLWAAGGGHVDLCQYLVETCGCDPAQPQQQYRRGFAGRTALHWACRKGHLMVVQYLLSKSTRLLYDRTADGTTAIGWAAWQGQVHILQWIYQTYCATEEGSEETTTGDNDANGTNDSNPNDADETNSQQQHDTTFEDRPPSKIPTADIFGTINKFGCNALLWAAQGTADDATMDWLVQVAGVSCTHVNANGHGILHKAGQRNRPAVALWLQKHILQYELGASDQIDITTITQVLLPLLGPDLEGCTPSDLAGVEGHLELAEQVREIETTLFRALLTRALELNNHPSSSSSPWTWFCPWKLDPTALMDEWGPGSGVARLEKVYQDVIAQHESKDDGAS